MAGRSTARVADDGEANGWDRLDSAQMSPVAPTWVAYSDSPVLRASLALTDASCCSIDYSRWQPSLAGLLRAVRRFRYEEEVEAHSRRRFSQPNGMDFCVAVALIHCRFERSCPRRFDGARNAGCVAGEISSYAAVRLLFGRLVRLSIFFTALAMALARNSAVCEASARPR